MPTRRGDASTPRPRRRPILARSAATDGRGAPPVPRARPLPDRARAGAPIGVDRRPLRDPPELQPVADPFRPFDPAAGIRNLDHLVFVVQENRSFDHYFGTFPGADGIPMDADGDPNVCLPDPTHDICHRPYHDRNLFDAGGPHGEYASEISIAGGR